MCVHPTTRVIFVCTSHNTCHICVYIPQHVLYMCVQPSTYWPAKLSCQRCNGVPSLLGYHKLAMDVAFKQKLYDEFIQIVVEDFQYYDMALDFLEVGDCDDFRQRYNLFAEDINNFNLESQMESGGNSLLAYTQRNPSGLLLKANRGKSELPSLLQDAHPSFDESAFNGGNATLNDTEGNSLVCKVLLKASIGRPLARHNPERCLRLIQRVGVRDISKMYLLLPLLSILIEDDDNEDYEIEVKDTSSCVNGKLSDCGNSKYADVDNDDTADNKHYLTGTSSVSYGHNLEMHKKRHLDVADAEIENEIAKQNLRLLVESFLDECASKVHAAFEDGERIITVLRNRSDETKMGSRSLMSFLVEIKLRRFEHLNDLIRCHEEDDDGCDNSCSFLELQKKTANFEHEILALLRRHMPLVCIMRF